MAPARARDRDAAAVDGGIGGIDHAGGVPHPRGMEWSGGGRVAGATALFLCAVNPVAAAPLDVRYELNVALSPAAHTIGGVALVTVTNQSDASLGDILLTLYPNHYGESNPALDRSRL